MSLQLRKATRKQVKLRLNLSAPSGAGKTYSALRMAYGIVGDWSKIAVIDTENSSASLYSHLGEFLTIDLTPPFSPERYIEAIKTCENGGIECCIIDSSSHEWSGAGGCIESNDTLAAAKYRGNSWSAWNETTPRHDKFVNTVLQSPMHVITCTRSKTETVMGDDKKVKKVGMKDIQRDGWEYELTVSLNIDRDTHLATPSKDRTGLFEGKLPFLITEQTGQEIKKWCETGVDEEKAIQDALERLKICKTVDDLTKLKIELPPFVVKSKLFISEATARHKEITTVKEAPKTEFTEQKKLEIAQEEAEEAARQHAGTLFGDKAKPGF